ncbi:MAG: 30S ribosomal protein S4 [Candidatus Brocadiaceae bacterium]|nr:30S ribosomal protein S4 [Candidatus Brocadiaceae bacterium]
MARYVGPQCRLCRREGEKLFLKGTRCDTAKCAVTKRKFPPGRANWSRSKLSKYGIQFREKQKAKRFYGILDSQFKIYYKKAERQKGNTGENLLVQLERRLDNVVHLLSFANSRKSARQLILHGHIAVNNKKVNIASYQVKIGDCIKAKNSERSMNIIKANNEVARTGSTPAWLELKVDAMEGMVTQLPTREEISASVQEQLIVELCSK